MKNTITIIASIFMLTTANIKAQVNYEYTYLTNNQFQSTFQEFWLTNLGNNNYKYVIYNYGFSPGASSFSLYNLNHTPYLLNVQIPIVSDSTAWVYYRLGYITSTLFDCDSTNIEYAVMLDSPEPNKSPNTAIYRTDGTVIFSKDSVGTIFSVGLGSGSYLMTPIMNTPAGAKLLLFNQPTNAQQHTYIYGLCGTLPENITEINQSSSFVKVFPNPASHQINFQITAPSHMEEYELTIFNAAFQSIKTSAVKGTNTKLSLDSEYLSSGTYFYSLQNKNKVFQTGKFVVVK